MLQVLSAPKLRTQKVQSSNQLIAGSFALRGIDTSLTVASVAPLVDDGTNTPDPDDDSDSLQWQNVSNPLEVNNV